MAKIAFIHSNNDDMGGSDISMWRLVRASMDEGHQPLVVLRRLNSVANRYAEMGVDVIPMPMPRPSKSLNPLAYARWGAGLGVAMLRLRQLLRRRGVELVYANDLGDMAAVWAGRLARLPTIVRIRWVLVGSALARRMYMTLLTRPADRVACNSDFTCTFNFSDMRIAPKKLITLYNWHEDTCVEDGPARTQSPFPAMGVPPDARVILMHGRMEPLKGQHVLIEAAPKVLRAVEEAVVVFVGPSVSGRGREHYAEQLRTRAAELGVADRVFFHPHVDAVVPLLRHADVVVHASTQPESFGLTVLEALWHNAPLVTVDQGGPREIVGAPPAALLHTPGDADPLADQVIRLLTDPPLRASLTQRGRERAATFSREVQWPHYRRLIQQLLHANASAGPNYNL